MANPHTNTVPYCDMCGSSKLDIERSAADVDLPFAECYCCDMTDVYDLVEGYLE